MKTLMVMFLILTASAFSQMSDLIKGRITDENGKPVQTKIKLTNSNGKEVELSSDSNGEFSSVIYEGYEYDISIYNYMIDENDKSISIAENKNYDEHVHNLKVREYKSGVFLGDFNVFESNSSQLKKDVKKLINYLKREQRNHNKKFKILVTTNESNLSKNKLKELLSNREKAIKMELYKYNLSDKKFQVESIEKYGDKKDSNIIIQVL